MTGAVGSGFVETTRGIRAGLIAAAALGVLALAIVLLDGLGLPDGPLGALPPDGAVCLAGVLASASCAGRALSVDRERRAWGLLAFGVGASALGWATWVGWVGGLEDPPTPSPSDALWSAFYPATYAALALMLRRSFVRAPAAMWLDGLLAGLAVAAVGVAVAYDPVRSLDGDLAALGTSVMFPIGDLLLVATVLAVIAMSGWRPGLRWITVGAGMLCWFAADSAYLGQVVDGDVVMGTVPDVLWIAGFAALGVAAWQQPRSPEGLRIEGVRMLLVPALFSALALLLLLVDRISPTNDVAVALALVAVAVGLARTTLTLREVQLLADARHESLTDELTGLPSRRQFNRRLERTIGEAADEALPFGLLLLDLNRFKELNDTLGHGAGDQLLQLVGRRLRDRLARGTLVARLGGDEFAVLLPPGQGREQAERAGAKVIEALTRPFEVEGLELDVGGSVGIAVFPEHADESGELLRRADVAMYLAKAAGGGVALYDPERDLHTRDRLALGRQLRAGLERDELVIYFQPKIDPQLGRVLGVEALARWQHPAHGLLMPPDFLPLAARSGLMPQLTRRVLDGALEQLARWRADGLDLTVAVNLAVSDLLDPDLPDDVARLLAKRDVPPTCLSLEVTEDGLIADPERAAATLDRIARLGVRISLDDFGTGWSSLAHLRRLPVDELKIDRSFVTDMASDGEDAAIVRTTLDLARSLRLRVVAEGVEDERTWTLLADLGCDAIQGFVLSRPLPGSQLGAWLAARRDGAIARCLPPGHEPEPVVQEPARFRF